MDIEQLKKDKADLEKKLQGLQIQLYRLDGALGYINDNIKDLQGVEDDRTRTDNKK